MKNGLLTVFILAVLGFSFSQVSATPSAFWDTLSDSKITSQSSARYSQPRTRWGASRGSRMQPRDSRHRSYTQAPVSCKVTAATRLPSHCVIKNSATRKGILSQIDYLRSGVTSSRGRIRQASYNDIGQYRLLKTANTLLRWFDDNNANSLAENFELHELDSRTGKVKYTGYFTPFISARKYPDNNYRYPIYAPPAGKYPNRRAIFN